MKKTRIVLVGALVLALAFVMGCKQSLDESVAEHHEGSSKFEHIWKAEYKGNSKYIRSALQFGSGDDKINKADVTIDMAYPQYGKSGLIFGLNNTKEKDINGNEVVKYNYYVVGLGEDPNRTDGTLQYYIDYCTNMTSLSGGNTSDETVDTSTGAKTTEVKRLTSIADISHDRNSKVEYDVSVSLKPDEEDKAKGTYTVKIKIGNKEITETIDHETYGYVEGKATYPAAGTIASYGMLSGKFADKKVDTTWLVNKETLAGAGANGLTLSAE